MYWLGQHPEIQVPTFELSDLKRHEPWDLVRTFYTRFPTPLDPLMLRGYKSPNDIGDVRPVRLLRVFFPETKLILGVRHPMEMMQSFYNFRVQNGHDMVPFEKLGNVNGGKHYGVFMGRAHYHSDLVHLGKTNLTSQELQYFAPQRKRQDLGR